MGFSILTRRSHLRTISSVGSTFKYLYRTMKNYADHLPNSLFARPTQALDQGAETLDKVLRSWVPEILNYPEQVKRIRQFVWEKPSREDSIRLGREELEQALMNTPPYISRPQFDDLLILIEGIRTASEHYQLQSEYELDTLLRAHKAAFRSSLMVENAHREKDGKRSPGENQDHP